MPTRLIGPLLFALLLSSSALAADVDESALRYYAANGQRERAEAEGRRLMALHPGWTVPPEVWTDRASPPDEKPLWQLFANNDIDGLKRAIAERGKAEPGWRPSDDLARKLARKELRLALLAHAGKAQWLAISDLAGSFGKGADVDDVELAWIVAEGFARSDRQPEAFALLGAILARRVDPQERRATIQKALALLPMADVEQLLAMGKMGSDGAPEFAALAIDVTRGRIAAILHDEREASLEPAEIKAFEDYARAADDPSQPGLVAWLALKQNRLPDALQWFKHAIARGGDATIAHGLAHTLLRLGHRREVEEVAFAWRGPLTNNAILFIDVLETELTKPVPPSIEPERLARYARVTLETRSAEGAQGLGWYAYNSCQFETALGWFQRASAWQPKENTIYGQALALQRLKRQREFVELVNRYDGLFPKVVELAFAGPTEELPGPCDRPATAPAVEQVRMAAGTVHVPGPVMSTMPVSSRLMRRVAFPVAVSAENALRFPEAVRQPVADAARSGPSERPVLVARRVGGVVAMPYEQLGFTLLPGWGGAEQPATIPAAAQPVPRGTLWASQQDAMARQAAAPVPTDPVTGAATRFRR